MVATGQPILPAKVLLMLPHLILGFGMNILEEEELAVDLTILLTS